MGVLSELLSIKAFRENKAELDVRRERVRLAESVAAREQAERELAAFQAKAREDELRWYAELCERVVRLRDIERVQLDVALLRMTEAGLDRSRASAVQAELDRQAALTQAKDLHAQAARTKEKFVELVRVSALEDAREFERKEDAELEEVAELRRDRADWEEHHADEEQAA